MSTARPDQVLDTTDPGDDVAARFHYQHCHAAIHALKMILPKSTVAEVICENHEDFLVSHTDGTVVAVQVKTRDATQPPFKAKDDQIIKALARFAKLETQFPGAFKCYEFLTNQPLWENEESDNNFPHLLKSLHERKALKGLKKTNPLRGWVGRICEEAGLTEDQVVAALLKCSSTVKNDTVESARKDVLEAISECPALSNLALGKARNLAAGLIELARSASTRSSGASVLALYDAGSDFKSVLAHQKLEAKRIQKVHVEKIIAEASKPCVETLCVDEFAEISDVPKTLSVMYQKLEKGELELDRVQQLESLVYSFEALYFKWAAREGAEEARRKINDLKAVVQFDCTEAKVDAATRGTPYASEMYKKLYERLAERCANGSSSVYECRPEHLMGTAGILTQECTVWWSDKFVIAAKEGT